MLNPSPRSRLHSNHSRTSCIGCKLAEIGARKQLFKYLPGQVVFLEGDPSSGIYCISSGVVALERGGTSGATSIVGLRQSGDTLGYRAFVSNSPQSHSAIATTESEVCYVDNSVFATFLAGNPSSARAFTCEMFDKIDEAEKMFIGSRMLPVRGRLANVLLLMKDRHATANEVGQLTFELPFSRQMLASLVGARPESLSRAIRALEDDGVACFRGRKVLVHDLDELLDEIEQRPSRSPAGASGTL